MTGVQPRPGSAGLGQAGAASAGAEPGLGFTQVLSIADALPMPIAVLDRALRYRFVNRALAEFFGEERRTILGRPMGDLLGEAAVAERRPLLEAALRGERQWFAADYHHPQRGPLALQTEYIPQLGEDGAVTGVIAIVQDVTGQRFAEQTLRESEERFRRIADSAPVMMWVTRLDRHREFVNDAYLEFAGIARAEMNSHDWRNWIHPADFDRVVRESLAGEDSRQPFTLEARYRRHDGAWRWLRSVSRPRFAPHGDLLGFIGAAFDITVAKAAEDELRRAVADRTAELSASEDRFRAVFDTALEFMALMTPDGEYLEINRTARELLGFNPEEVQGKKAWELPPVVGDADATAEMRRLIERAAAGATAESELTVGAGPAKATHLASVKPVLGTDGRPIYLVGEARDVSELRVAQEQLRQSQKMEALGQLTGGIAHDFNNLLTVVVGGLDLIARRETDPKLQRYAQNALEAAERGARLTAQLLAFSRVQRLEVRPTHVEPLIENMRSLLRNVLGPGVAKEFFLDTHRVPVLADPTQLELAVLNLAINARDAMPDGGVLTFRTERVEVAGDPELEPGEYLKLSIRDTGIGMPPEVIDRAFEPFFTTKEVGKGTGLGLSMVYGVARQSGGTARIQSGPGEGTCIELFFRRAQDEAAAEGAASDEQLEPNLPASASVLVIDDDPVVREFVAATLADWGYQVREAGDGPSGLAAFREWRPDVVVVDFAMPGMSGADVARTILQEQADQPILFVSGYSQTDAIKQAAPQAPMLAKPFRAEALDEMVRSLLAARPAGVATA